MMLYLYTPNSKTGPWNVSLPSCGSALESLDASGAIFLSGFVSGCSTWNEEGLYRKLWEMQNVDVCALSGSYLQIE